jgi:hypothetical protein
MVNTDAPLRRSDIDECDARGSHGESLRQLDTRLEIRNRQRKTWPQNAEKSHLMRCNTQTTVRKVQYSTNKWLKEGKSVGGFSWMWLSELLVVIPGAVFSPAIPETSKASFRSAGSRGDAGRGGWYWLARTPSLGYRKSFVTET